MNVKLKTMTVAELREKLDGLPSDANLSFGPRLGKALGSLTISMVHQRDTDLFNIEFIETFQVTHDPLASP